MYQIEAWLTPGGLFSERIVVPGEYEITIENIEEDQGTPEVPRKEMRTLIKMKGSGEHFNNADGTLGDCLTKDFDVLRRVIQRLSFSLLHSFTVTNTKVMPLGGKVGDKVHFWVSPGPPPGMGTEELPVGFEWTGTLNPAFLQGEVPIEAEGAISWYLKGMNTKNSIDQYICHWIGLEMLAPEVRGYWKCGKCNAEMPKCPACKKDTEMPKATQAIKSFLLNDLKIPKTEYELLYKIRNNISHGRITLDENGVRLVSEKAFRVQTLLLQGIKQSLGWPQDGPPLYTREGARFSNAIMLSGEHTIGPDDFIAD